MLQSTTASADSKHANLLALRGRGRATLVHPVRAALISAIAGALAAIGLATLLIAIPSTAVADGAAPGLMMLAVGVVGLATTRMASRSEGARRDREPTDPADAQVMRQQLGHYQALVESVSDTLFALDADGRFLYASSTVLSLLGVSPQAIVGRSFFDFIESQDVEQAQQHAIAFLRTHNDETRQRLFRMITVDGLLRHVEVRYGRPFAGNTDGTAVVGVLRDVSVTFAMTQRLRDERMRLRSIVDASGAMILLVDRDLAIRLANHEFKQLQPADPTTVESTVDIVTSGLAPGLLAQWRAGPLSRDDTRPVRFTRTLVDGEGAPRVFSITARPVIGADRCLSQIVFLGVDDTERQAAERALHDADRLATLGEMAATVVHELRQPLQVIVIACEAALEEPHDTALVVEKLRRIDGQVDRANHIIEDLRVFARGTGSEAPAPFDAEQAVRSAIGLTAAATRNAGMTVEPTLANNLPKIRGHAAKLEQVLINLINNARDAGAQGLKISAVLQSVGLDTPRILLAVDDNGPGIPPEVLPRLFKAFVTTKPSGKGTGLGLRICRRIIEEMGGTITAGNRPEGGARFAISLPVLG